MAESVFRTWTKAPDALSKLVERIEADLGDGEQDVERGRREFRPVSGLLSSGMEAYRANLLYAEHGNHWQGGRLWPVTYPTADIRERQLGKVAPMFCAVDVVGKALRHQNDALLGREATIAAVPVEPPEALPEGASEADKKAAADVRSDLEREGAAGVERLTAVWDAVQLWDQVRRSATRTGWAKRGPMRMRRLPSAVESVEGEGDERRAVRVSGLPFADAAARVTISAPLPLDAMIYTHPETREVAHIIRFADEGSDGAEVWFRHEGKTFRRILHADAEKVEELDLADAPLPLQEVTGPLLLTAAVRAQQAQINFFRTKLGRVVQTAADRLMFAANIEDPGDWSLQPPPPGVPVKTAEE